MHTVKSEAYIFGNKKSRPKVDQINAHWLASKLTKQKSSEKSRENEALVKTETLVSVLTDKNKKLRLRPKQKRRQGNYSKGRQQKGNQEKRRL